MGGVWSDIKSGVGDVAKTGLGVMTGGAMGGLPGGGMGGLVQRGMGMLGGGQPAPQGYPGAVPGYPQTQGPSAYPGYPVPQQPGPHPTYNFQGDQSGPGAAEQFYAQNQGRFTQPTQASGYWSQNQQRFGQPGQGDQFWNQAQGMFNEHRAGGKPSNNAQTAFDQFQAQTPANTSPYYQRASDLATHKLQNAQAAQGILGSSVGTQQIADAQANLLGQQALADANYGLQRGATAGNLASGADLSSRGASQDALGWLGGLGQLALGTQAGDTSRMLAGGQLANLSDQGGLAQLMSGMNAAQGAQGALRNRAQDYFNNTMGLGGAEAGILGNNYGQALQNNQALFMAQLEAQLAPYREQLNQSLNGRASSEQGLGNLMSMAGSLKSAGGLGGLLGGLG